MLVIVADSEGVAVTVDDLDAAAEIKCKVETRSKRYRNLFIEIKKTACGLAKRLDAPIATKVEFQSDWRCAPAVRSLARSVNDKRGAGRE